MDLVVGSLRGKVSAINESASSINAFTVNKEDDKGVFVFRAFGKGQAEYERIKKL